MNNNIAIATTSVRLDTALSDAEFREAIEAVARQIEHFERAAIFKIANRLAWVHEQFLYRRDEGGFQGWVESRLGYSRTQAYRLLDVARLIKSIPDWDTFGTLPVTALYQLAAPSTPVPVRDEILDRLKAGERLSCATVTEVIAKAKDIETESTAPAIESIPGNSAGKINGLAADGAGAEREKTGAIETDGTENAESVDDAAAKSVEARKALYAAGDADHVDDNRADAGGDHVGGDGRAEDDPRAGDNHVDGSGGDPAEEPEADLETLAARWAMSTRKEQQEIRGEVLADFFAESSSNYTADLIPAAKRANVVRVLLDAIGVDGMLTAISPEFRQALCAKLPGKPKKFKTERAVQTGTDATGKPVFTLKGRGNRSQVH
jgi:hypothetical protein